MKRFNRLAVAMLAFVIAAGALLPTLPVNAANDGTSSALSISPRKNYVIKPGNTIRDKLVIRNVSDNAPLNLTLNVIDFTYTDTSGTAKLLLDRQNPTTWSLKPYVSLPQSVMIPPNSSKSVPISITIPAGHGAGSLYSAILYSAGAPGAGDGKTQVGLQASGTTLVFANIPGKVKENLKLNQLGAYHESHAGVEAGFSFITTSMPDEIGYTLTNSGNVVESPAGSIILTDIFGRKTQISDINPRNLLALIGQKRTFTSCIKLDTSKTKISGSSAKVDSCNSPGLWPGYYNVALDAFYGQNGNQTQEVVGHAAFLYLPLWFILIVLALIAVIAFYGWRLKRRLQGVRPQAKHRRRR